MSHFDLIRRQARDFRREIGGEKWDVLIPAETLLEKAYEVTKIKCLPVEKTDAMLCGASAVLDVDRIYFDKTLPAAYAAFCRAHEYAHFRLHEISAHCAPEEISFSVAETEAFDPESRVLGYGQSERTEREANCFAAEFLLPARAANRAFFVENLKASEIARRTGLPVNLVFSQLAQSLIEISDFKSQISDAEKFQISNLKSQNAERVEEFQISDFKFQNAEQSEILKLKFGDEKQSEILNFKSEIDKNQRSKIKDQKSKIEDQTQIAASQTGICPTLLEAAPGTGKTRTLVERICFLINEKQIAPETVLALTFSNKAAEEMRERIAAAVGKETATRLYMTTFHAFGLNLLRKYFNAANLPDGAPVIDRIAAVGILEENFALLKLKHFQDLREPLANLPAILGTISRAKDELVSAGDFQKLAERQFEKAETAEQIETAEKCLETARVYRIYERILRERGILDYGDLIFRAVCLLRDNAEIRRSVGGEFRHVLVDEYQDVNRASAELLRLVASGGADVWAVGDARQAIYRWRGAATTRNVRDFAKDFPQPQNLFLGKNYRSRPRIVSALSCFAEELSESETSQSFTDWTAHRADETGEIRFAVTENLAEEAAWMARQMRGLRENGLPWREQAVIARTHNILQKIAEELEKQRIPVLYIGNWLESRAARDLLSWLAFIGEDNYAIVRAANFTDFKIDFAIVQRIVSESVDGEISPFEAIQTVLKSNDLDGKTRDSLTKLSEDFSLSALENGVWKILANFLFENGAYLKNAENQLNASARLAIYQILLLAQSFDRKKSSENLSLSTMIQAFLRYVRRLKIFGEEQTLQQLPASLQETDAVRLLTIHASKGLEFEAVYVPFLGARYYPKSRKANVCPLPEGVTDADEKAEHEREEKSLFFVAISRARQVLCLSRSTRYGKQTSNASPFLKILAAHLPSSPESGATWYSDDFQPEPEETKEIPPPENFQKPEFFLRELEEYRRCPRLYFYRTRLKRENGAGAVYLEFHRALHKSLDFCKSAAAEKRAVSLEEMREFFLENFTPDAYAEIYAAEASEILQNAHQRIAVFENDGNLTKKKRHLDLPNARVLFEADLCRETIEEDGKIKITIEHWRNGKLRKKESDEILYQLLHEAARTNEAEAEIRVLSLKSGEEVFVPRKLRRGREIPPEEKFFALVKAAHKIQRGDFAPKPSDNCPSCRFYFICPA